MGDKRQALPYTSAKSAHRAFSGKVAFRFCRKKMLDFLSGAYSFRKTGVHLCGIRATG
jgi:hypothetical protein